MQLFGGHKTSGTAEEQSRRNLPPTKGDPMSSVLLNFVSSCVSHTWTVFKLKIQYFRMTQQENTRTTLIFSKCGRKATLKSKLAFKEPITEAFILHGSRKAERLVALNSICSACRNKINLPKSVKAAEKLSLSDEAAFGISY